MTADTTKRLSPPDTKAGQLQREILRRLREREASGDEDALPTSIRFIFYELEQAGVVPKHKPRVEGEGKVGRRADQNVIDAVMRLREASEIPWEWISDETRQMQSWRYAATAAKYLIETVPNIRLDVWDAKPPPMILTESRSLAGVLDNLAYRYLAPIASTNGQVGGFLRTDIAPELQPGQRVLYLGDRDLQGDQIEANTRDVLERCIGGKLDWRRIAITEAQVAARPDIPRIIKHDRRYTDGRPHDGRNGSARASRNRRHRAARAQCPPAGTASRRSGMRARRAGRYPAPPAEKAMTGWKDWKPGDPGVGCARAPG